MCAILLALTLCFLLRCPDESGREKLEERVASLMATVKKASMNKDQMALLAVNEVNETRKRYISSRRTPPPPGPSPAFPSPSPPLPSYHHHTTFFLFRPPFTFSVFFRDIAIGNSILVRMHHAP